MKAIILAAGIGKRLKPLTDNTPKCLMEVGGQALIERYVYYLSALGVKDIVLVTGHLSNLIEVRLKDFQPKVKFVYNPDYKDGNVTSLYAARAEMSEDCLLMDADVYFERKLLEKLIKSGNSNSFLLDSRATASGEEMMLGVKDKRVVFIGRGPQERFDLLGEGVGFVKLSRESALRLVEILQEFVSNGLTGSEYEECLQELIKRDYFGFELANGLKWTEIDFKEDIAKAKTLAEEINGDN